MLSALRDGDILSVVVKHVNYKPVDTVKNIRKKFRHELDYTTTTTKNNIQHAREIINYLSELTVLVSPINNWTKF